MGVDELKGYLEEIKDSIRNKTYKPELVRRVEIPKPDGGVQNLGVPTVLDRFVQQAIAQVLIPIYESIFSDNSFGLSLIHIFVGEAQSTGGRKSKQYILNKDYYLSLIHIWELRIWLQGLLRLTWIQHH